MEAENERLVDLLYSSESMSFWREFLPRAPPPLLTKLYSWTQYASTLYMIPTSHITIPLDFQSFLYSQHMVCDAIDQLKCKHTRDIEDLQAELLIHIVEFLAPVLAALLNNMVLLVQKCRIPHSREL
ncbi:hypothetical protein O6H91_Y362100 [Diphasiastrum complanatum]|nr:hypothetical protein O6H91_Y362100 [Diphasiastrum complanatum]